MGSVAIKELLFSDSQWAQGQGGLEDYPRWWLFDEQLPESGDQAPGPPTIISGDPGDKEVSAGKCLNGRVFSSPGIVSRAPDLARYSRALPAPIRSCLEPIL